MSLRSILMIVIYSLIFTLLFIFNTDLLMLFHRISFTLSNLWGIDPNFSFSIVGGGFANDITILLFFFAVILELVISEKIFLFLDKIDTILWNLLKS